MFTPGSIYFIKKYEYEDGGAPSDKLLIVVCIDSENSLILRALTTSQQKVPDSMLNHGCTTNDIFSFYLFLGNRIVGVDKDGNDFSFDLNTFVFFRDNVKIIPYAKILNYYPDRINLLATLKNDELKRFLKCITSSKLLGRKEKKFLLEHK
ncbi:hypothetical protein SAMN05443429_1119 [Cruoricaptor ignavus]|uniref:Uncharacterized protein n=1 Tax=Cruoricaptor ignavus TaxID=1118202 RepID=A0A1M6H355_9FLAO|nr:hypothetical protein [Cruoricaptor ignavus]SHJ16635.1 hypothetical protein SAMN05443429_1119 [Cruoricaptor ignavus]